MKKILTLVCAAALISSCSMLQKKGVESTNWLGNKIEFFGVEKEAVKQYDAERKPETMLSLKATENAYPKTMYNPETTVIVYKFDKKSSDLPQADDFYREEIFLEIPSTNFKKTYKDQAIEEVKLIYGKHCYCKGLAGYYRIDNGVLTIKNSDKETEVEITFKEPKTEEQKTVHFKVQNP